MASKGLSGAAPVLEGYGLSCEHDLSLLVQEDLNALSSQLTPFHSRILRTWVQGLAAADQHQHVQCHFWRGSEKGLRGLP